MASDANPMLTPAGPSASAAFGLRLAAGAGSGGCSGGGSSAASAGVGGCDDDDDDGAASEDSSLNGNATNPMLVSKTACQGGLTVGI